LLVVITERKRNSIEFLFLVSLRFFFQGVVLDIILILIESVFNSSSSLLFLKQLSISGVPLIDETIQIHRVMPVV
jgi:hypothetical protein